MIIVLDPGSKTLTGAGLRVFSTLSELNTYRKANKVDKSNPDYLIIGPTTFDTLVSGVEESRVVVLRLLLSTEMDKARKVIYIRPDNGVDGAINPMVIAHNGEIRTNIGYLSNERTVRELVNGVGSELITTGGSDTILNLVAKLGEGGNGLRPFEINRLRTETNAIVKRNDNLQREIELTAKDSKRSLSEAAAAVREQGKYLRKMKDQVERLSTMVQADKPSTLTVGIPVNASRAYATIDIKATPNKKYIVFKDLSQTPYLLSFTLGLRDSMSGRTKVIVLVPPDNLYYTRYSENSEYYKVNKRKGGNANGYLFLTSSVGAREHEEACAETTVFINYINSDALKPLLSDTSWDNFIIVDRTTAKSTAAVRILGINGNKASRAIYVSTSKNLVDAVQSGAGVNKIVWITSMVDRSASGSLLTIPTINGYERMGILQRKGEYEKMTSEYNMVKNTAWSGGRG